ncbi:hypothetical protein PS943_01313 [Pseudomonas fluorescens]|uniref:Uncharacterized protein n=1 Tax=Pseudomonas fluorescens TaxID=294 RepID=A0A5E7W2Z4_PSEFL|nr:hypothetical protein PS943_01313 [Pseudomonas fluorescens]
MSRSGCSFNQMTQGLILFERGYCRCRGSVGRGYRSAQGDEIGARLSLQRSGAEGSLCGQCIGQFRAQSERRASSRKGFAEQVATGRTTTGNSGGGIQQLFTIDPTGDADCSEQAGTENRVVR